MFSPTVYYQNPLVSKYRCQCDSGDSMQIYHTGRPQKVSIKECKKALNFYALAMMSKQLTDNITIRLKFNRDQELVDYGWMGYCDWIDDNLRPREFEIVADSTFSRRKLLITLAHEMVHVKQFAKGQMKDFIRNKYTLWRGKMYKDEKGSVYSPWEREAYRLELPLYNHYKEHIKEIDDTF